MALASTTVEAKIDRPRLTNRPALSRNRLEHLIHSIEDALEDDQLTDAACVRLIAERIARALEPERTSTRIHES